MSGRHREMAIETPEGVRFALPLAGPVTRFLAWVIDLLVIAAALSTLGSATRILAAINPDWMMASGTIAYFVISVGYGMALEWWWRGQTIGKRVMKLRVVDAQGLKLQFSQIAMRNLLRFLDSLPLLYLVGGAAIFFTRDAQRLGDLAANTIVIRQKELALGSLAPIAPGKFNSLREHPHLAARLRQKMTPELVEIAVQTLARRDELAAGPRVELFELLAAKVRGLVTYPEEVGAALTDEQYVRDAVEVAVGRPPASEKVQRAG